MSEFELKKIIDDLKREILLLNKKIARIDERHYKEDIINLTNPS
jgi:hypothetical protein|tara:strand:+ start:1944 stop:2075 length:132 start_codon:yes stop_codon:yes gene_type:complete